MTLQMETQGSVVWPRARATKRSSESTPFARKGGGGYGNAIIKMMMMHKASHALGGDGDIVGKK